jgi:peptide/nickel transport system substrate-binding protein
VKVKYFNLSLFFSFLFLISVAQAENYGGTLRVGLSHLLPPDQLNPLLWSQAKVMMIPVYSLLVRFNESGQVVPDLAYAWEVSEDGLNYTFYLFDNVTWHDGVKFNASDVKFTWDTVLTNPDVSDFISAFYSDIISSVEIKNETTIVFNLKKPYGDFLQVIGSEYFVPILPKHLYEGTSLKNNPYNLQPVGTGPFKFYEFNPGINLTVTANENYFRGRPYLDNITFRWDIPILQLPDFLANNTIDLVPENMDPNKIDELSKIPGITITFADELGYIGIGINFNNPILSNKDVRHALMYAINRTDIIQTSYLGYARIANTSYSPALTSWINPNVPYYEYNVTKAEELLNQAGYPRDENGIRFNLTFIVGNWDPLRINASALIEQYLNAVGINVTRKIESLGYWYYDLLMGNFDLIMVGFAYLPTVDLSDLWHTQGETNFWGYSNSTLDSLLEQGKNTTNQTLRKEIYDQVQYILAEDLPNLFLYHRIRINDHNNDFHNFVTIPEVMSTDPYSLEKVWYNKTLSGQVESPVSISFIDSKGRLTGWDRCTKKIEEQIPGTYYIYNPPFQPPLVKVTSPLESYIIEVVGKGDGEYKLEVVNLALEYKNSVIIGGSITENERIHYSILTFPNGSIKVFKVLLTDVNGDGKVDMKDVSLAIKAFGSYPGNERWDPRADVNGDCKVDIKDIALIIKDFGKYTQESYEAERLSVKETTEKSLNKFETKITSTDIPSKTWEGICSRFNLPCKLIRPI